MPHLDELCCPLKRKHGSWDFLLSFPRRLHMRKYEYEERKRLESACQYRMADVTPPPLNDV